MPRNLFNTDPESFRGKLLLLIFDKVVLGAMIGIALFLYTRWQINDQRAYEDRTTLAFQRAGYVKELVPMVVDSARDLPARSQALIALIETGSVGDKNALGLTEILLRQGLIRSNYPERLRWNGDHPLIDALETRMPSALEPLLNHYLVSAVPDDKRQLDMHRQSDIETFWSILFVRTLNRHSDAQLALLDSDEFLSRYLFVMDRLVDRVDGALRQKYAKAWFARGVKGLRILAALRSVGDVGMSGHALGRRYLLTVVSPPSLTAPNIELAETVIRLQEERQWASRTLAMRCLEIFLRDEDGRLPAAGSYVEWYAKAKRDEAKSPFVEGDGGNGWDEIQPALVAGLRTYLSQNVSMKSSIALPLARILLDGIERGEKPSDETRQLLTEMASFSDERLSAFLLDRIDLRQRVSRAFRQ